MNSDIPHKVQGLVIREYAKLHGLILGLSQTELLLESREQALKMLEDKKTQDVVFYSSQIFLQNNDYYLLKKILERGCRLHFALEEKRIESLSELESFFKFGVPEKFKKSEIRFNDLSYAHHDRSEVLSRIDRILSSGKILNSNEINDLEGDFNNYFGFGTKTIAVSSGTGALVMGLLALGINPGDEVILPCVSWISTAHAVSFIGAVPVFADVNRKLSISIDSCKKLITNKTKAVIAVHFLGKVASEIEELKSFCDQGKLLLIEDSSQGFGAFKEDKKVGSFGAISCISLNPMKTLGGVGEAGIITTRDERIHQECLKLRYCGLEDKKNSSRVSLNFRMDAIQAAIISYNLSVFSEKRIHLKALYKRYVELLKSHIEYIDEDKNEELAYYGFSIFSDKREMLISYLNDFGIETKIQHEPLMSEQTSYQDCVRDDLIAQKMIKQVLTLPLHFKMSLDNVDYICSKIKGFLKQ